MIPSMKEPLIIKEASDVTSDCLEAAEGIFEGWYDNDGEPIDWIGFLDRLEGWGYCATEVDSPAVRKIQRHIRNFRRES